MTGIKLMELCPISALQGIAKTLISIWEAVQLVGVRLASDTFTYPSHYQTFFSVS